MTFRVTRQSATWKRKKSEPLKPRGQRGRRMAAGDRAQEAATHVLPCCCGCNAHLRPGVDGVPGKGLVSRAHLESRRFESTRNDDFNNLPACEHLAHWLDRETGGSRARKELLRLAKKARLRLAPGEVQPIISKYGYYTWLHNRTRV